MDKIVEFLLDYYIWILAVLGIAIVTVIGFLVDSKQKRKKNAKEKKVENPVEEVKTVEPLPDVNVQNAVPIVEAKNQPVPTVVDNVIGGDGTYVNSVNNNQQIQQAQSVSASNIGNSSLNNIQTLNEQKPHFEPQNITIPASNGNGIVNNMNNQVVTPKPVNAVSINQPVQNQQPQTINAVPFNQTIQRPVNYNNQLPPQQVNLQSSVVVPNYQNTNMQVVQPQMPKPQPMANVNNQQVSNINQMSMQSKPIASQVSHPQVQPAVVNNFKEPIGNMQQSNVTNQQVTSPPNIGISFVTGENGNTNNNGDNWHL